jgi:hypothetical protein
MANPDLHLHPRLYLAPAPAPNPIPDPSQAFPNTFLEMKQKAD